MRRTRIPESSHKRFRPHPLPLDDAKGLPPACACYATQTDHRAQVERADKRRAKHAVVKQRRILDRLAASGEEPVDDVKSIGCREYWNTWQKVNYPAPKEGGACHSISNRPLADR